MLSVLEALVEEGDKEKDEEQGVVRFLICSIGTLLPCSASLYLD